MLWFFNRKIESSMAKLLWWTSVYWHATNSFTPINCVFALCSPNKKIPIANVNAEIYWFVHCWFQIILLIASSSSSFSWLLVESSLNARSLLCHSIFASSLCRSAHALRCVTFIYFRNRFVHFLTSLFNSVFHSRGKWTALYTIWHDNQ